MWSNGNGVVDAADPDGTRAIPRNLSLIQKNNGHSQYPQQRKHHLGCKRPRMAPIFCLSAGPCIFDPQKLAALPLAGEVPKWNQVGRDPPRQRSQFLFKRAQILDPHV